MWSELIQVVLDSAGPCLALAFLAALLVIFALVKEWVVLGTTHRRMVDDRDFWRGRTETGTALAAVATGALEQSDV